MEIRGVAVIGLGTMGAGIAEVFARAGLAVTVVEADPQALSRGMGVLSGSLDRAVARGRLAEPERDEILARVTPEGAIADAGAADLVVEVVPERMEIKRSVFAELDRVCRPDAILATNTSSLSVTAIAAGTAHPERVVGMHFFNPAPVMRLVEVVTTVLTSGAVAEAVTGLAGRLGKTPVAVTDRAGFVANALLLPYLNHAARLAGSGYASRADIDDAMRLGAGLPMGPLALLDLIGLDTSLSILEVLAAEFGGTRYTPAPLLRRLADAGLTGRKSGRGFYSYTAPETEAPASAAATPSSVYVIGAGPGGVALDAAHRLAATIEAAGVRVTRDLLAGAAAAGPPSGPGESGAPEAGEPAGGGSPAAAGGMVLVAAAPAAGVLEAALAAGVPGAVGLHLSGGKVAEVVVTPTVTAGAAERAANLARLAGFTPVRCPDRPGLLVAALLYPHINDAARMLEDGYASAADIDDAMVLGCGYPRGPLRMADDLGPQRVRAVLAAMHGRTGDPAFAPVPILAEHAAAGLEFHQDRPEASAS